MEIKGSSTRRQECCKFGFSNPRLKVKFRPAVFGYSRVFIYIYKIEYRKNFIDIKSKRSEVLFEKV